MDLIQLIGFGMGFLALIYIFANKRREERLKQENPQEWERMQAERGNDLKKLLRSMDLDLFEDEEEQRPRTSQQKIQHASASPKALPAKKQAQLSTVPAVPALKHIAPTSTAIITHTFRVNSLIRNSQAVRDGMIMKEILSTPRSLKPYDFPE